MNMKGDTLTAIIEIPKESAAKIEMVKDKPNHPLIQNTRTNIYNNK